MRAYTKHFFIVMFFCVLSFAACEKEVSVSPDDPPPDSGVIVVSSNPLHAAIYLNDKITGKFTPDTIKCLPADNYKITLKIENYNDTVVTVQLDKNARKELFVDINNNPAMMGGIMCRTTPAEADIYINDSLITGKTPYLIKNLFPGRYKIKFSKYEYWDDSVYVTVRSSDNSLINRKLTDSTLWVCYKMTNSGLPTNYINCVYEDKNFVIWIGTFDKGLVKFRDNKWTNYNTSNSGITNNNITRIAVDNSNNVWLGTYDAGLIKFDGTNFTKYNTYNSPLPDNQIRAVQVDASGRVWIGTGGGGVVYIEGENWTKFDTSNSELPSNRIRSIAFDNMGDTWIGTYDGGIAKYSGTFWKVYTLKSSRFPSNNVDCIYTEGSQVWFGSAPYNVPQGSSSNNGGISYFNGSVWISYKNKPDAVITDVCSDSKNNLWIGTTKFGLWRYTKPFSFNIQYTTSSSPLPNLSIADIMIDHNNHKWIATNGGGLAKYKGL